MIIISESTIALEPQAQVHQYYDKGNVDVEWGENQNQKSHNKLRDPTRQRQPHKRQGKRTNEPAMQTNHKHL